MTLIALAEAETRGLLYERAIEHYTRARTAAESQGDDETAALAAWRIGKIYLEGIANPSLARANLTRARELYAKLLSTPEGSEVITAIEEDLAALPAP